MPQDITAGLRADIAAALKGGDKARAELLRLLLAAAKQAEIDGGKALDDAAFVAVVEKMIKQRRESVRHFDAGGRADLAEKENSEIALLSEFMPAQLDAAAVAAAIDAAISETAAASLKDMGKVMAHLKPRIAGRADMQKVSAAVKSKLAG